MSTCLVSSLVCLFNIMTALLHTSARNDNNSYEVFRHGIQLRKRWVCVCVSIDFIPFILHECAIFPKTLEQCEWKIVLAIAVAIIRKL